MEKKSCCVEKEYSMNLKRLLELIEKGLQKYENDNQSLLVYFTTNACNLSIDGDDLLRVLTKNSYFLFMFKNNLVCFTIIFTLKKSLPALNLIIEF